MKPYIRWMIRCDLPECLAMDQAHSVEPWCEKDFIHQLRKRNVIGLVVEDIAQHEPPLCGFMVYELHKRKCVVLHMTAECDEAFDRMLAKLASKLSSHRRPVVEWDVDERDDDALAAIKRNGWRALSVLRSVNSVGGDAYRCVCRLPNCAEFYAESDDSAQV